MANRKASTLRNKPPDKEQARDLALLLYVATIGGRVVLTGFRAGEAAIDRIDNLIAEILAARSEPA